MVKKVVEVLEKSGIMRNIAVLGHKKEEVIPNFIWHPLPHLISISDPAIMNGTPLNNT